MRNLIRRAVVAGAGAVLAAGLPVAAAGSVSAAGRVAAAGPVLAFTPSPYDFGQVTVGQMAAQKFTLANSGRSASRALKVTLAGSGDFTITADTCTGTSLGPRTSCTVTVQFTPASAGTVTATLTAANNKRTVLATNPLTGTGMIPGHLYWTDTAEGTIREASLDGSGPRPIVTGQTAPAGVAIDSSHIYWADAGIGTGTGTIMAANLDGTGVTTLVSGQNVPAGVAVDSSHIYWVDQNGGTIMAANLDGSGVTTLESGLNSPFGVAVGPR